MDLLLFLVICLFGYWTYRYFKLLPVVASLRKESTEIIVLLNNSRNEAAGLRQKIQQDAIDRRDRFLEYRENDLKRPEVQLRVLVNASIRQKKLLNREETKVFYAAKRVEERLPCLVFAQVSMGEIMRTEDSEAGEAAYAAINSKRIDILICNTSGLPILAIEHQGSGHYREGAEKRDAVKRLAFERAGIALLETFPETSTHELEKIIFEAVPKNKMNGSTATHA